MRLIPESGACYENAAQLVIGAALTAALAGGSSAPTETDVSNSQNERVGVQQFGFPVSPIPESAAVIEPRSNGS